MQENLDCLLEINLLLEMHLFLSFWRLGLGLWLGASIHVVVGEKAGEVAFKELEIKAEESADV